MAFKITVRKIGEGQIVQAEGCLDETALPDFLDTCSKIQGGYHVDLGGLLSASANGLESLRSLNRQGVRIQGASPYINQLLNGDGDSWE